MAVFAYRALAPDGASTSGEIEAADRREALRRLAARQLRPVSVQSRGERQTLSQTDDAVDEDYFKSEENPGRFARKRSKALVALSFLKKDLTLLRAGMPLGDSLALLTNRLADPAEKALAQALWRRISEGRTLAAAMAEKPDYFSESTVHLIEAGEASGNLPFVMEQIVTSIEETREMRQKITAGLAYPAFIALVAFGVVLFFIFFMLPRLRDMIDTLGGEVPWFTQLLMSSSEAFVYVGPALLGMAGLTAFGIAQWRKSPSGRTTTDRWVLRIPSIGKIYLYANIFQTTHLMATLLDSGVNTTETLRLVERTILNTRLRAKFAAARKQIQEGVSMATAIKRVHIMPPTAMDILTVGENTGSVTNSLRDINQLYRAELTKRLGRLQTTLTATAFSCAFGLVAMVAISFVLSIFGVYDTLGL